MVKIELIDVIIIFCMVIVIIAMFLAGLIFYKESKGKSENYRKYLLGISLFLLLYGINRCIFFLHELFFDPFMWSMPLDEYIYQMESTEWRFIRYDIIWRISTSIGSIGLFIFLYVFELQILEKRTHFILSLIQLFSLASSVILGAASDKLTVGRIILYFGLLPALAVPFIYIYLGIKASGPTRKRAIGAGIGFLIWYVGISANSSAGKNLGFGYWGLSGLQLMYILYAILNILGLYIYIKSIKEPKKVKLPKKEKILPEFEFDEAQQSLIDVLAQSRPSVITEEEVKLYREQEICLVCKGKLSRLIYLCPDCKALYCVKCVRVLSEVENACWVCTTPFDESKPVKSLEVEEDIKLLEKIDNGKKVSKNK